MSSNFGVNISPHGLPGWVFFLGLGVPGISISPATSSSCQERVRSWTVSGFFSTGATPLAFSVCPFIWLTFGIGALKYKKTRHWFLALFRNDILCKRFQKVRRSKERGLQKVYQIANNYTSAIKVLLLITYIKKLFYKFNFLCSLKINKFD